MITFQKKSVIFLGFLLGCSLLFSQEKQSLKIQVTNIKSAKGTIMVAVYNSPLSFLGEQVAKGWAEPVTKKGKLNIDVKDLPTGSYAISIYHDINDNGKLDSNIFRIPKEPYGFSNNPKNKIGVPSFEKAKFTIPTSAKQISIALK